MPRGKPLKPRDHVQRFLGKVAFDPISGCWLWDAALSRGYPLKYGRFRIYGKSEDAHRMSWRFFHGEIPRGCCVCHKCDVPSCVNPDHLFIGTHRDNNRDMVLKGRHRS